MAANTVFKQQCPHCEKSVPIKDEKLIGEEIKCPKCKNPFVVEDPSDTIQVKAKKTKTIDEAAGAGGEEGEEAEGKKAGSKSTMMLVGGGLAVVVVILLGVAAFFLMGSKPNQASSMAKGVPQQQGTEPDTPKPQQPAAPPPAAEPPRETAASVASAGNPTSLLPNDTEVIVSVQVQEVLRTPVGRELLTSSGGGGTGPIEKRYGLNIEEVERWIVAGSYSQDWLFHVVRTKKPIRKDTVKTALHLKPAEAPIEGQDYFVTPENWLESGSPLRMADKRRLAPAPPGTRPLAVRFADLETIVMGDLVPMQEFLKAKGHPQPKASPGAQQAAAAEGAAPRILTSNEYSSLSPRLRSMLLEAESRPPVLFSYAIDMENVTKSVTPFEKMPINDALAAIGLGLHMKDAIFLTSVVEAKSEEDARNATRHFSQWFHSLEALAPKMGMKLEIAETLPPPPAAAPGQPGGGGGGGGQAPGAITRRGGGRGFNPSGTPPPAAPAPAPEPAAALAAQLPILKIFLSLKGSVISIGIDVPTDQKLYETLVEWLRPHLARPENELEMMAAHPEQHQLALALHQFGDDHRQFPQGTARRPPSPARANRPWHPDQRVSWMAELLPYLGYDATYAQVKPQKSWRDPDNVSASVTFIPPFVAPDTPRSTWFIQYPGLKYEVAATHYVGIAGIGEDAAEYSPGNPALAAKLGAFGYDRVTRVADILDGLSNTILVAQVPPLYKGPWIAGGGSTVRGVPEKNSIQPFVSTTNNGKRGTIVIMADGSVRFLSDQISDEVFKAMCTIRGGEPRLNLDRIAPKLALPEPDEEKDEVKPPAKK
jgi:hypothetical protein